MTGLIVDEKGKHLNGIQNQLSKTMDQRKLNLGLCINMEKNVGNG